MLNEASSPLIQLSFLQELQQEFQRNSTELIELYLHDAKRKIAAIHKALEEHNLSNLTAAAKSLRQRSLSIGAISFSFRCLHLEMAVQEMRLETLFYLVFSLEKRFIQVYEALEKLKTDQNCTATEKNPRECRLLL